MFLNAALKKYASENLDVAADASDDDFKAAISKALQDGKLTGEKYAELIAQKDVTPKSVKDEIVDGIGDKFEAALERLSKTLAGQQPAVEKTEPVEKPAESKSVEDIVNEKLASVTEMVEKAMSRPQPNQENGLANVGSEFDILKDATLADDEHVGHIRVKDAVERYNDTKTAAVRTKGINKGETIKHMGRELNKSTDRTMAMTGAWAKFTLFPEHMKEHELAIIDYALNTQKFYMDNEQDARRLTERERIECKRHHLSKATTLLDGSTSGGENAVPEFFDTDAILLPTLGGELAPFVNMVDVPRGSSADTYTMGNPTFAAKDEGTAVTLFTTDSFIANHDTTFFRAAGGIEVGLNFLQDSVSRVAMDIVNSYSRVAAEWLDEQIAAGDGTTEPQGVIVANGTTDITPTNPTTGALTITDVLNLLFGVSKAYKKHVNGKGKAAFGMTETTYKRLRSIATGLTGDSRLIFGEDVENYMLFGHPVAIEENGLSNADIFFAQLGGYRMYRRQGLKFRRETAGITLAKTNTMYIGADMRYGGQLDRGGYAAVVDAAPA